MDTKTFLETVLGDSGYYCVWAANATSSRIVQKFYESIDAALHTAYDLDKNGYDTYFALGTFEAANSRKAANVKQLKSFFLDLDCGQSKHEEGKGYLTQADALAALRVLCKKIKLPRPTIVNSGRGVHVYWPLTEPVSRETWLPVAERFKRLCQQEGLIIDAAVPADAARILRVPDTHNYKDDPPLPVNIIGAPAEPLTFDAFKTLMVGDDVEEEVLKRPARFRPQNQDAMMQALSGSYVSRFKTIILKTVAGNGCAQLGEVVLNQENVSEPMWRAGLSIAKFCVDGGKAIHNISNKHPQYSAENTEEKAALVKGPYLCTTFDEYRTGVCHECKHWGKIKSPISLGREVQEAAPEDNIVVQKPLGVVAATPIKYVIPTYPQPYFRGASGGVFKHTKNDDGDAKDKLIYFNDLYVVRRLRDPEFGEAVVMRLHLPKDGVREFTVPNAIVGSKDEFRKCLASHGVAVLNVSELMEYTMRWINELQFTSEAEKTCRQFGWTSDKAESFTAGASLIFADRVEINAPSGATVGLFPYFNPKGTLDGWKETMKFYNRPTMELHQYMVGIAFGSPLMHFMPVNAAAFHAFSKDSGLGKTTGMLAGASVWGDPMLLMMQERDTFNSKMNRAEVYKNLPCYMDELTNTHPKDLSDWAYQLPSGLQRNRMGPKGNIERVRGEPWSLLFASTGNTSALERVALYKALPKAEAQRILERRVDRVAFESKAETDRFAAAVMENFGHAGVVYIQYILNNKQAMLELIASVQKKIDAAAGLTAENRFWSAQGTVVIAGLMMAKRAGLIDWDISRIVAWFIDTVMKAKMAVKEMSSDVETILTDYLAENYNSMLRIKSTDDSRGKQLALDQIIAPEAAPRGNSFVARYEHDVKKLYLLPKPLKEWCGKQQINYSGLIEELKSGRTKAVKAKARLSKGTNMNFPPVDAIILDCSGFMTDETEEAMATTAALFQTQG